MESEPAFPIAHGEVECPQCDWIVSHGSNGLTKREWFAGQLMPWALNQTYFDESIKPMTGKHHFAHAAEFAIQAADALITALEKP